MKNRKIILSGALVFLMICLLSYFVISNIFNLTGLSGKVVPINISYYKNISGTAFNLSVNVTAVRGNNTDITNISVMWQLAYNASRLVANNSVMLNVTMNNYTANQTVFSTIIDTTSLPNGIFNLSILVGNYTGSILSNDSFLLNITIDNIIPSIWGLTPTNTATNLNYTHANVNGSKVPFNESFNATVRDALSNVKNVYFMFNNASSTKRGFNVTATNKSGIWNVHYNVSSLRAGSHVVTVIAKDFSGSVNMSQHTFTFSLNTPPNVTFSFTRNVTNQNFTLISGNQTFNITVSNASFKTPLSLVYLRFDNASGADFNYHVGHPNLTDVSPNKGSLNGALTQWNFSYNVSTLTDGSHTVTAYVNDSLGNTNNSQTLTFIVDNSAPTITVTCSPSSPTVGATVTCTCSAADSGSGIKVSGRFAGSGLTTESTAADGLGTKQSSYCTAWDHAGNRGSATGGYTVVSASDTGGGSAGGSGGGSSSGSPGKASQKTWSSVYAGETATLEVENSVIGVTKVSFGVSETVYGGWIRVSREEGVPSQAEDFGQKIYRVVQVAKASSFKDNVITTPEIDFKVEKSWLTGFGLGKNQVALFRLVDNKWEKLPTAFVSDDGTYLNYRATAKGFSYFIIGEAVLEQGERVVPVEQPSGEPSEEPSGEKPADGGLEEEKAVSTGAIAVVALVVLVILGLVWYFFGRK